MILSKLAAASLFVGVAAGPVVETPALRHLSIHQKNTAAQVYAASATDCIARSVAADTRFHSEQPAEGLGDLIVDAVPKCLGAVRAMIDAYDRYFGDGMGEEFFMGPYLDILPSAIIKVSKTTAK
jgi:hypothetical protein